MSEPDDILQELADVYRDKEQDYGAAWKLAGEIFYILAGEEPVTIESPEEWIYIGLYYERLIKIIRSFNGEFNLDKEMNFEDIEDSLKDPAVYAVMHASMYEEE